MNNSDTSHYENVPNNWAITSFEEIVELISGRDLETSSCNDIKEGIPYLIGASNIVKRSLFITRWTTKPIVISQKNDILISCKGTIGEVIRNTIGDIHIARQFMALRNNSIVDTNYIELYNRAILERIKSDARGVIPGISREDILCREIILPPLNEQKRIVLEANKLISIIEKINVDKNELVKAIAAYKLTILQLAITGKLVPQDLSDEPAIDLLRRVNPNYKPCDNRHYANVPYKVPPKWQWVTLSDISNYGECINVPVSNIPENSWILELEDIEKDSGRLIQRMNRSKKNINGVRHSFKKGDVLYSKLRTYLNKVLVADQDGYCTTEIIPITCVPGIVPEYLCHVLRSRYYVDYTISLGYGVKMPRLGTADALKSMIPVPPYEEQRRIVKSVNEIYHKLEQISSEL